MLPLKDARILLEGRRFTKDKVVRQKQSFLAFIAFILVFAFNNCDGGGFHTASTTVADSNNGVSGSPLPASTPAPVSASPTPPLMSTPEATPTPTPIPQPTVPMTTPTPTPTATPTPTHTPASVGSQATWSAFLGANNVGSPLPSSMGVGWARFGNECSWPTTEPSQGTFSYGNCDNSVNTAIQQNLRVVMLLAYFPSWAGTADGTAVANPQTAYDWATAMVKRYKPMGVTYYQVANEPTAQAGFWHGTDQQLVNTFLGPIQQAIKDNGGIVIGPAWPSINSIPELINNVLKASTPGGTYTNDTGKKIYQTLDMVDIHYYGLLGWQGIWNSFPAGTFKGLMQSEFGFTTEVGYFAWNYASMLSWALSPTGGNWQNDTSATGKYDFGVAWYAGCCATDGGTQPINNNLTTDGTTLTENGIEAAAMNTALGGGVLSVYTSYTGISNAFGFNVGNNVTLALFNTGTQTVQASGFTARPSSVSAIDFQGNKVSVTASYNGGTETISVQGNGSGIYIMINR